MIKNITELSKTLLRKQALDIVEAGIFRVLPSTVMKQAVKFDPLQKILTIK